MVYDRCNCTAAKTEGALGAMDSQNSAQMGEQRAGPAPASVAADDEDHSVFDYLQEEQRARDVPASDADDVKEESRDADRAL